MINKKYNFIFTFFNRRITRYEAKVLKVTLINCKKWKLNK